MNYEKLDQLLDSMIINQTIMDMAREGLEQSCKDFNENIASVDLEIIGLDDNLDKKIAKVNIMFDQMMKENNINLKGTNAEQD